MGVTGSYKYADKVYYTHDWSTNTSNWDIVNNLGGEAPSALGSLESRNIDHDFWCVVSNRSSTQGPLAWYTNVATGKYDKINIQMRVLAGYIYWVDFYGSRVGASWKKFGRVTHTMDASAYYTYTLALPSDFVDITSATFGFVVSTNSVGNKWTVVKFWLSDD